MHSNEPKATNHNQERASTDSKNKETELSETLASKSNATPMNPSRAVRESGEAVVWQQPVIVQKTEKDYRLNSNTISPLSSFGRSSEEN